MSAANNNTGFTVPKGPKEKLSVEEARKRFQQSLKDLEDGMSELKHLIDELEKVVS